MGNRIDFNVRALRNESCREKLPDSVPPSLELGLIRASFKERVEALLKQAERNDDGELIVPFEVGFGFLKYFDSFFPDWHLVAANYVDIDVKMLRRLPENEIILKVLCSSIKMIDLDKEIRSATPFVAPEGYKTRAGANFHDFLNSGGINVDIMFRDLRFTLESMEGRMSAPDDVVAELKYVLSMFGV